MKLGDSLVDERLGLGLGGRDGEMDLALAGHEVGMMSRAVVEGLAVERVARRRTAGLVSVAEAVGLPGS